MCGIFLHIFKTKNDNDDLQYSKDDLKSTFQIIERRGPDAISRRLLKLNEDFSIIIVASVLHLRGKETVPQPHDAGENAIFLWNGELFGGLTEEKGICDTVIIGDLLNKAKNDDEILKILEQIKGPMSFVLVQTGRNKIWFGRDYFGRRSLLYHQSANEFLLASAACVCYEYEWKEIPAVGIFSLELSESDILIKCYPWISITEQKKFKFEINQNLPFPIKYCQIQNVKLRPPLEAFNHTVDENEIIESCCKLQSDNIPLLQLIMESNTSLNQTAAQFLQVLKHSVKLRVANVPTNSNNDTGAPVAVLFSGGIDCTVLAALSSLYIEDNKPIDLLNVAFENVKNPNYQVPDRITGYKSYLQLKKVFPNRIWNFIEINVTKNQLSHERNKTIRHLINPLTSVLDDSIGCAIWFAAQGKGQITTTKFCCKAKVVICGMGADEQLAGYSRHRSAFEKGGNPALQQEIAIELERISSRNLGRDDRVVSDSGREARFPFLDENVVSFLNSLKVHEKADLRYPRGVGEKILLRIAALKLGLEDIASFPKRAIQFGSRIAKCEGKKEKAGDACNRLIQVKDE